MAATRPIQEFYRDSDRYRSLGEQYNNLGNIKQLHSGTWLGQVGVGWDANNRTAFKAFATVEDGIVAQAYIIERTLFRKGQTFQAIIEPYAPPSENNTPAYVAHVAGRVDRIARGLGYSGPKIDGNTDLRKLVENPQYRNAVLAATVKAMNEVEIGGRDSDRIAPASRILAAIQSKYANENDAPHTAFQKYARAIGRDPGIRAPSRRRNGIADTADEAAWHQPTNADIDAVGDDMFKEFVSLLVAIFKALFGLKDKSISVSPPAPASPGDTQAPNIPPAPRSNEPPAAGRQ